MDTQLGVSPRKSLILFPAVINYPIVVVVCFTLGVAPAKILGGAEGTKRKRESDKIIF